MDWNHTFQSTQLSTPLRRGALDEETREKLDVSSSAIVVDVEEDSVVGGVLRRFSRILKDVDF